MSGWRLSTQTWSKFACRKRLPIHPAPKRSEPFYGYLIRLAKAYGYGSPRAIWNALGQQGLPRFAQHLGITTNFLQGLSAPSPSYSGHEGQLRGMASADINHFYTRWCPCCLAESPWLRPEWSLKISVACPHHRTLLNDRCPLCGRLQSWERGSLGRCECGQDLSRVSPRDAEPALVDFQLAINKALMAEDESNVIAFNRSLTLPQCIRMIKYIGQFADGDLPARPGQIAGLHLLDVALTVVRGSIFLLDDWPAGFRSRLEFFLGKSPPHLSVRTTFGTLYRALYSELKDPDFQFLRTEFERFLQDHWWGVLCRRHRAFHNKSANQPTRIGLTPFAKNTRVSNATLRSLILSGEIEVIQVAQPSGRQTTTLSPNQTEKAVACAQDITDLRSTCRILGLRRRRVLDLVDGKILHPLPRPERQAGSHWFFSKKDLDSLLTHLQENCRASLLSVQSVSLRHVLQFWQISGEEFCLLIRALVAGSASAHAGQGTRIPDIHFDESALQIWLSNVRNQAEWLSIEEAANLMGLKQQVAYCLVEHGFLQAERHAKGKRIVRRVSKTSINAFGQTYVSLAQLASLKGISPKAYLSKSEVRPVTGPGIDGCRQYFFRRTDVSY